MRLREAQAKGLRTGGEVLSRDDALLYLATFIIVAIGFWGVAFALESDVRALILLGGAVLGFLSSIYARQTKTPLVSALLPLAGLLGILLLLDLSGGGIATEILPNNAAGTSPEISAISSLSLVLLLCSFVLINREMLSFCIVPVLAIFGLLGYFIAPQVIIAFLFFLLVSIFLLVYEHTVTLRERERLRLSAGETRHLPQNQLLVSTGFFLAVLAVSFALTVLLVTLFSRQKLTGVVEAISRVMTFNPALNAGKASASLQSAQDDFRVGQGPIFLGQETVMFVKASYPGLWRQRVYDTYDGAGWKISESGEDPHRVRLKAGSGTLLPLPPQARLHTQDFRLAANFLDGLPAEAQPAQVAFKNVSPLQVVVDRFGCLVKADFALPKGTTYEVLSLPNDRPASAETPPVLSHLERGFCLQTPWGTRRVRQLVQQLVPRKATPEEKLKILMEYLQSDRYTYNLQAAATPAGEDAVDYFLFRSHEGYCDLFASSFAIMCRAANIPSRVAVGFATGDLDSRTGEYVVKQADGHAWVEVFLDKQGWVTMDPTPAGAAQLAREQLKAPVPAWQRTWRRLRIPIIFLGLAALVAAALLKIMFFDPWWEQSRWEKRMLGSREGKIAIYYARMLRLLGNRGMLRQPWQTPQEYLAQISRSKPGWKASLVPAEELTGLFIAARYRGGVTGEEQVTQAEQALANFRLAFAKVKKVPPAARKPLLSKPAKP